MTRGQRGGESRARDQSEKAVKEGDQLSEMLLGPSCQMCLGPDLRFGGEGGMGISEWEEPGWLCRVAGKHGDSRGGCGDDSRSHNLLGPPREEGAEDAGERVCALVDCMDWWWRVGREPAGSRTQQRGRSRRREECRPGRGLGRTKEVWQV